MNSNKVNKEYVKRVLNYVKAPPYADTYGEWGALNRKQRETIMELCLSWLYLNSIVSSIPINKDGTYNIQLKIENTPKEKNINRLINTIKTHIPKPLKEDKKIKRIQSCGDNLYSEYIGEWLVHKENYSEYDELLMNKINEIIDRLNGEE